MKNSDQRRQDNIGLAVVSITLAVFVLLASSVLATAQQTVRYATDGYGMGALAIIAAEKIGNPVCNNAVRDEAGESDVLR